MLISGESPMWCGGGGPQGWGLVAMLFRSLLLFRIFLKRSQMSKATMPKAAVPPTPMPAAAPGLRLEDLTSTVVAVLLVPVDGGPVVVGLPGTEVVDDV